MGYVTVDKKTSKKTISKLAKFQLIYSLSGLILGLLSIIFGLVLALNGVIRKSKEKEENKILNCGHFVMPVISKQYEPSAILVKSIIDEKNFF